VNDPSCRQEGGCDGYLRVKGGKDGIASCAKDAEQILKRGK